MRNFLIVLKKGVDLCKKCCEIKFYKCPNNYHQRKIDYNFNYYDIYVLDFEHCNNNYSLLECSLLSISDEKNIKKNLLNCKNKEIYQS